MSYVVPQSDVKEVDFLRENRSKTSITWIGHSTFLIQFKGLNIVTDPVWAKRMGFSKRLSGPGLTMNELPPIDIVLISHGHYDHLHIPSLRALPGDPLLLVPEGLASMLGKKGFKKVKEVPWWSSVEENGVTFDMVPAQHWTRRTPWDTNTSHWGGWTIREGGASEGAIYFAGDSGYFHGFKKIGEAYSIDTALIPIGAYDPEWFMKVSHMTPEEAVQTYLDLGAKKFIPMHYGAFRLADDTAEEALMRLKNEWERREISGQELVIMDLGQTIKD
ncbi:L-ascorbate metabolism protein UlaG (beta-lactamase superfamily) [Bacillus horti]|uniref:L-ascorbate metabolism protein UlaG (Beta-lactamase superfamily) n=1 Tax=Caldalkalibacillus horti TaxID=77523 RepID=A0ABT9VU44_9BACI|nr:L-ascorbate metabolism protein UlaG (beta-lactamase superfamily) [Bacillus horti]